jgi:hypothetical protein
MLSHHKLVYGIPQRYLLRWRFTYSDHKPDKHGLWLDSGGPETMAAFTSKENLAVAMIEGRDLVTRTNKVMWEVPGDDFVNFEFLGAVSVPGLGVKGSVTLAPKILGARARLVTRDKISTVFVSGRTKQEDRLQADKDRHYTGFGR